MPSNQDYNEICYLNRYPDLKNGIMFLSSVSNKWQYGDANNKPHKKLSDNLFWHWQNFGMAEAAFVAAIFRERFTVQILMQALTWQGTRI